MFTDKGVAYIESQMLARISPVSANRFLELGYQGLTFLNLSVAGCSTRLALSIWN